LEFTALWKPFREDTSVAADVLPFHDAYRELLLNGEMLHI